MLPNLYLYYSWTVSDFFVFPLGRKSEVDSSSPWPNNSPLYQLPGLPRYHSGKESACWYRRCEMQVWSLGWEDPLEEELATLSSILAWEVPWTEEPGGLPPMGSQKSRTQLSSWAHIRVSCLQRKRKKTSVKPACLEIGLARFALVRGMKTLWFSSILHFSCSSYLKTCHKYSIFRLDFLTKQSFKISKSSDLKNKMSDKKEKYCWKIQYSVFEIL